MHEIAKRIAAKAVAAPSVAHQCICLIGHTDMDARSIGSGFLLRHDERLFLVTAAHVPSQSPGFSNFEIWPKSLAVNFDDQGSVGSFDLFEGGRPIFKMYRAPNGTLSDMIAIPFPAGEWPTIQYELDLSPVAHGDMLTAFGFPEKKGFKRPYSPPDEIEGRYLHHVGGGWHTSLPVREGHSGGPVLLNGKLRGMVIGADDQGLTPMVIPAEHLRLLFR